MTWHFLQLLLLTTLGTMMHKNVENILLNLFAFFSDVPHTKNYLVGCVIFRLKWALHDLNIYIFLTETFKFVSNYNKELFILIRVNLCPSVI